MPRSEADQGHEEDRNPALETHLLQIGGHAFPACWDRNGMGYAVPTFGLWQGQAISLTERHDEVTCPDCRRCIN